MTVKFGLYGIFMVCIGLVICHGFTYRLQPYANSLTRRKFFETTSFSIDQSYQPLDTAHERSLINGVKSFVRASKQHLPLIVPTVALARLLKVIIPSSLLSSQQLQHFIFPITFLTAYIPCLIWGLPKSKIGSWKSLISIWHRIGGVLTLLLPLLCAIWERMTHLHVPLPLYGFVVSMILINVIMGASLIPRRIPAYDIPTLRAFAVGVNLAISFTTMSLFYRFGHLASYTILGKIFSVYALYTVAYAWSDALQHLFNYIMKNDEVKHEIGKKWYLPFQSSNWKHIFITCFYQQPTAKALQATVSPANIITVSTTFLTAIFASIALLQTRFLFTGFESIAMMQGAYPEIMRWSCYEALLAVVANNFGTFAGTLVVQNKVSQRTAGLFNAIGLLIPVLHIVGFVFSSEKGVISTIQALMKTSIGKF